MRGAVLYQIDIQYIATVSTWMALLDLCRAKPLASYGWSRDRVFTDLTPTGRTPTAGCQIRVAWLLDWQPHDACLALVDALPRRHSSSTVQWEPIKGKLETNQAIMAVRYLSFASWQAINPSAN